MAKFEFKGMDEYAEKITKLGKAGVGIIKYSVYGAADMVIGAIKANTPVDSGDLKESAILTNFKNEKGFIYTSVQFVGYDEKGTPNAIKARVLENGSSTRRKHPFIRPAVRAVEKQAIAKIEASMNEKINQIMK